MREEHIRAALALSITKGLGARSLKRLMDRFLSPEAIYQAPPEDLAQEQVPAKAIRAILQQEHFAQAEAIYERCRAEAWHIYIYGDTDYPQRLLDLPEPPFVLYFKGNCGLEYGRFLTVIGTRSPTRRGIKACADFLSELAPYQPLVISGLAYGIDAQAHEQALQLGLESLAVVGHGLDIVYPAVHRDLARRLEAQGGILSEYPPGTRPNREHFPMRNRILAGLGDALLLVETAASGGSIITAEYAHSYQKEVFALPGRIGDPYSEGCNRLIQKHKARLTLGAEELAEALGWKPRAQKRPSQKELFSQLSEEEQSILRLLSGKERLHLSHLLEESRFGTAQLNVLLLNLELKGLLRSLPGNFYASN